MLNNEQIANYITGLMEGLMNLPENNQITRSYNLEYSYDSHEDAVFTYKFLSATTTYESTQIPIQLIASVKNENDYSKQIYNILSSLTANYNQFQNEYEGHYIQVLLGTPVVLGTFQEDGIDERTSYSYEINVIVSDKVVIGSTIKINDEELHGIVNVYYTSQKGSNETLDNLSPVKANVFTGITVALTIDLAMLSNDEVQKKLRADSDKLINYNITYESGGVVKNYPMMLQSLTETCPKDNIATMRLAFSVNHV